MAGACADTSAPPIRVLHVIGSLDVGGAEVVMQRLVLASQGNGLLHEVVSLTTIGPVGDALVQAGIPVSCLNARSLISLPGAVMRLRQIIRQRHPDVVQTWLYHADLIGGIAARLAGLRTIAWSVHSTHLHFGTSRLTLRLRGVLARLSSWLPARIIYVANASRQVHEACGYAASKAQVIPNGFDVNRYRPNARARGRLRDDLAIPPENRVVGSVGRYNADKDHATLFRAAALVLRRHTNCTFVLAGAGVSDDNAEIRHLLTQLNLPASSFRLLGLRQDIPAVLNTMDVFCLHSRSEAFPLALGEAMACGVPPVTTDVGDAGLLAGPDVKPVPPGDVQALANELCAHLSLNDDTLAAMGQATRQHIVDQFAFDKMVQQYMDTYKAMVEEQV